MKLYIDGELKGTEPTIAQASPNNLRGGGSQERGVISNFPYPVNIGRLAGNHAQDVQTTYTADAQMDNVAIYDKYMPDGEGKHIFLMTDPEKLAAVQQVFGNDQRALALHINFGVLEETCCRISFLRGAFLSGGSVTDPQKGYHLELSTSHQSVSREMVALMRDLELEPKDAPRKGNAVIYFKQSDRIEDFLTSIGAPISAMEVMNAKLEKDLRGSVNRRVNCDAANLDKAVEAAQGQIEAIRILEENGVLATLPEKLQEVARLRQEHPADTLVQLAGRCDPPITKSALNHRLRKLIEMSKAKE